MKKLKMLGDTLMVISFLSLLGSFILACEIGEVEIFHIPGMIRYSWIMMLFLPIEICCFLVGIKIKQMNGEYKQYCIVSIVCGLLLITVGCGSFVFKDAVSFDTQEIVYAQEKMDIYVPQQIEVATSFNTTYNESYVKIVDETEKRMFEQDILTSGKWAPSLNGAIKEELSINLQAFLLKYTHYLFYNVTTGEFNKNPILGEQECILLAYNMESGEFLVITRCEIDVKATS